MTERGKSSETSRNPLSGVADGLLVQFICNNISDLTVLCVH
jgi:hypothetical protein